MRNQQIKKVNRVFFSGQDEEKRKWIEQMATEGWQLISESSFLYSFQKVASEMVEVQSSYRSILSKDFQKSMPIFQDTRQDWPALLSERITDQNTPALFKLPKIYDAKAESLTKKRRLLVGLLALSIFLIVSLTKAAIISSGDFLSLFKLQFLAGILFVGFSLAIGTILLLKSFLKILSVECKSRK